MVGERRRPRRSGTGKDPWSGGWGFCGDGATAGNGVVESWYELLDSWYGEEIWKLFAEGLLLPLGILAVSNSEVLVMQLTNLMRIKDTDGDGHADLYENATSDFGVSGNHCLRYFLGPP